MKKKRGRPKGSVSDNSASVTIPRVRVTPDNLLSYKRAAIALGVPFSEFTRDALDKFVKFTERGRASRIDNIKSNNVYRFILMNGSELILSVKKIHDDKIQVQKLPLVTRSYVPNNNSHLKKYWINKIDIYDIRGSDLKKI